MSGILDQLWAPILGVAGWIAAHFFGSPVLGFYKIRGEVRRRTLLHWDAPEAHTIEPAERPHNYENQSDARTAFAELGAQLVSFDQSEWIASWYVRKLGFRPAEAGNVLRKIALEFGTSDEDRQKTFRRLDTALKFKFDPDWPFYNPYNPGPHKKN
jgi:hypothetical protein